jgi:hypothetical protein
VIQEISVYRYYRQKTGTHNKIFCQLVTFLVGQQKQASLCRGMGWALGTFHKAVEPGSIQAHMKCTVVVEVGEDLTSTAVGID